MLFHNTDPRQIHFRLLIPKVKEIAKYFSYEVNNFLFKPEKIATEQIDSPDMNPSINFR